MPPKSTKEAAPDQSTLNRHFGLQGAAPKQSRLRFSSANPAPPPPPNAQPNADDDKSATMAPKSNKMDVDLDAESSGAASSGKGVKRRTGVVESSDAEDDNTEAPGGSSAAKKPKLDPTDPASFTEYIAQLSPQSRVKVELNYMLLSGGKRIANSVFDDHPAHTPISSVVASLESKSKSESKLKSKPETKPKPPVSSFFAPRKPAEPKPSTSTATGDKSKGKGKAKASSEDESVSSEKPAGHDADEGDDDEEEPDTEEEEETAVKLAEIFTSKRSDDDKKLTWKAGDPVPYRALTGTFDLIQNTTKRLEIARYLTRFLIDVIELTPGDLLKTVYLCINRLCPDYEPLELGIGESILQKAISEGTGRKVAQIKADFKRIGDLGLVAQESREKQKVLFKPKPLTVNHVFEKLTQIAKASGTGAQRRKENLIQGLLAACVGVETKYLIRSLEGKLRIGLAERTVIVALAHAAVTTEITKSGKRLSQDKTTKMLEEGCDILKAVFSEIPSYDLVVPALLNKGIMNLKEACSLTPGIPLKPMLAKPTKAISEVLDRFEGKRFTCEYKYDGERAQVHYLEDGSIKVFSRNSEDMSLKYPDIVVQLPAAINKEAGTTSFVIDCEAVAWDKEEKRLLPFQELSRRKRKDVKAEDIKVKVHLFAFDLLYLNGAPLLNENLEERRRLLRQHLKPVEEEFAFATSDDATSVEQIQVFLDQSVKEGCEGLMVKMLEGEGATYEPSRRSIHWLKLKKDYLAGVGDSFDLVVIGADFGAGKRTGVYGAFHLACFDEETQTYQAICKIGTGFSDEALKSHHERLQKGKKREEGQDEEEDEDRTVGELTKKPSDVDMGSVAPANLPDVYFDPATSMVWEVLAADLSLSPIYPAAAGRCDPARGISLRFPRFIRIRDDKNPEQATDSEQVADAYRRQATVTKTGKFGKKGGAGAEDDFW